MKAQIFAGFYASVVISNLIIPYIAYGLQRAFIEVFLVLESLMDFYYLTRGLDYSYSHSFIHSFIPIKQNKEMPASIEPVLQAHQFWWL